MKATRFAPFIQARGVAVLLMAAVVLWSLGAVAVETPTERLLGLLSILADDPLVMLPRFMENIALPENADLLATFLEDPGVLGEPNSDIEYTGLFFNPLFFEIVAMDFTAANDPEWFRVAPLPEYLTPSPQGFAFVYDEVIVIFQEGLLVPPTGRPALRESAEAYRDGIQHMPSADMQVIQIATRDANRAGPPEIARMMENPRAFFAQEGVPSDLLEDWQIIVIARGSIPEDVLAVTVAPAAEGRIVAHTALVYVASRLDEEAGMIQIAGIAIAEAF